ncbi:assimilatory nitrate reductase (NADH) alpha subunit apoprotein [Kushneria sinocarnis]|uniref:Assimilatory nitrate reductase (NADH) alpha subunit apoprotein n=1 Tax=Kushneria sinocarnis TaxID=595502 RepID=A0A420WUB7_9GAMM|nr:nitrate reductase [Kushneria sinocarnis]RKQ97022.1 assimilatory nitrate reductase (NADH) alpha subunit apoprotein [Kushneria sinocarnis]
MQAKTTCPYCGVGCGVTAELSEQDGCRTLTGVGGDPAHPASFGRLCVKGSALHETLGQHDRLRRARVDGLETELGQALDGVAERLAAIRCEHGSNAIAGYLSGQLLTEDYYIANKLFKGYLGTPHVDTNSRLCMASAVAAYKRAFGADAVPCNYEDLEEAELVVLSGSNLAWNHPVLFQRLRAAKSRNPLMRVVVIDPRVTDTCELADLFLPIAPGSDTRLFNGLLSYMAAKGRLDQRYLERHTRGSGEALAAAREDAPDIATVAHHCELDPERLETFYYWFASHLHVVTLFSQGINQSASGTDQCNAIINCHLAGGQIGLPGAGPFSITGQPNAMGGREVGGLANQLAAHMDYHTPGAIERVTRFWRTEHLTPTLPEAPGHKAMALIEAIERGEIKALWIMATNPLVSLPDSRRVRAALERCPLVIVSECMAHNDTLALADIVLPASSWAEKDGTVTNSERRISRQRGLLPPPGDACHDWQLMAGVARRMGFGEAFAHVHPAEIFDEHARLSGFENDPAAADWRIFDISGLAGLGREGYDALAPIQWPVNAAHPQGAARLFEEGRFVTGDGRARLVAVTSQPSVQQRTADAPLILNTGRIRDQWHTMTRTARAPRLMHHRPEPFIETHPEDASARGVVEGALARLHNGLGEYIGRVRLTTAQRRGEVFVPIHWNDRFASRARASELIAAVGDPLSGQPESKRGVVQLSPRPVAWEACLLLATTSGVVPEAADWWARIPLNHCQRWQLAGESLPDWFEWCEATLGDTPTLWSEDAGRGCFRAAGIREGRLTWWLAVMPPGELPEFDWLEACFAGESLDPEARRRLLAGSEASAESSGATVCSCHQVGCRTIERAIRDGSNTVEALGERLACGTQCGSCIPELKNLIEATEAQQEHADDHETVVS